MESHRGKTGSQHNVAAWVGSGIALAAFVVWMSVWLMPLPQEQAAAPREPQSPTASDQSPPVRAVPRENKAQPQEAPVAVAQTPPPASAQPAAKPAIESEKPAPVAKVQEPKPVSEASSKAARPRAETAPPRSDAALEALLGRYTGNLYESSTDMVGLTLVISSVERGVIKATASLGGRGCQGNYPMQGTFANNRLDLKATRNGGPAGDCPLTLRLTAQGARLAGESGSGNRVEVSR